MNVDRAFAVAQLLARGLVSSLVGLTAMIIFGEEPTRHVSTVVKLSHLAVILPELQEVREDWHCDLWTPTVEQVATAEKVVLQRIKELSKTKETVDRQKVEADAKYIIQYYGLVLEKRKWIVCSVVNIKSLVEAARCGDPELEMKVTLETLLTSPYSETDSTNWFDVFYDPSTGKLSESMGLLSPKAARGNKGVGSL